MKPLLLLLLLLLLTFLSSTGAGTGTLLSDAIALASLRKALNTPATSTLDSWNTSNLHSVCSWFGVRCAGGRVVSLELSNLNISSTYTSLSISNLSSLLNLSLAGNAFDCEIKLSSMPNLLYLNLSTNQFNGDLNWDYSTIQSLEVFDVYDNNFTAPLPAGVTSLKKLRHLDLGGNYFYGTIPASYGSLRNLEYLQLAGNDLRGRIPGELGNLTSLTELSLGYYNSFEGGIPAELGKLVTLVTLDLSKCSLDGEIPKHLGSLFNLNTLYLHSNLLSGNIPSSIGNLSSLLFLDLSNNGLTGEIPGELANLQQLRLLNLFLNRLHGSLPEYLAEMPSLETLGLFMNNFTGAIPENLGSNGRIQLLDLSSNKFTGTVPNSLCSSNQLRVLILFNNFLFGAIPETLGNCLSLAKLRMGQNYLNGTIPSGLLYLPKLFLLELQSNYLSGPLSESQNNNNNNNNSQLAQLNLSNNLLSGSLPSSISILSSLQTLLVSDNRLQGPVPASIGSLHQLVKLDLSSNTLSGSIPPEISNCSQLTYLDLSQNNLSGDIPQEISGIEILNYLNLSRNHFSHSIPKSIAGMKSLTSADFSFNDFSGRLPDTGQFAYFNASAFAGNPRLCGAVLNNPCNLSAIPATTAATTRHVSGDFKLVFALSLLVCSLIFAIIAIIKARAYKQGNGDKAGAWKLTTFQRVEFSIADVLECMKDSNVIGRGGAGVVYIGRTPSGQEEFAVKRLLGFSTGGHDHGFKAEVKTLGNIRHRNIVRLLGFCSNSEMNVLVYEFMSNGSLGEMLHGKGGGFLGWDRRYRIALEAARGLCYLHHDCCPMIVHRDVKSNNILLDSQLEAHVADFGLAKFLQDDSAASQCMSAIAGSYGYIAPEYAYTLRVDEKSDVYSYGVVLLELITGRRPVGGFGDGVDIVQWAKKTTGCNKDNVASIVDSRLSTLPVDEAMHVFFIAMLCVQENSVERPTMREVVQMLTEIHRHAALEQSPSSSSSDHHKIDSHCYKLFPDLLT